MNQIDFEIRAWEILNNVVQLEKLAAENPSGVRKVRDMLAEASDGLVTLLAKIESDRLRNAR